MRAQLSKEWYLKQARLEADVSEDVGAGIAAMHPTYTSPSSADEENLSTPVIFGRLIQFLRERNCLSIDALADRADIDAESIRAIEAESEEHPEPRTVYQLSKVFHLSSVKLSVLAGLSSPRDFAAREDGVKFAARLDPTENFSALDRQALENLAAVLSERKT